MTECLFQKKKERVFVVVVVKYIRKKERKNIIYLFFLFFLFLSRNFLFQFPSFLKFLENFMLSEK